MKKQYFARVFLLLCLCFVMVLALASCGEPSNPPADNTPEPQYVTVNYWYKGEIALTRQFEVGKTFELATVPQKDGSNVFYGWFIKDTDTEFTAGTVAPETQLDLVARYGPEIFTYSVRYVLNGGTMVDTNYCTSYTSQQIKEDILLPIAQRNGYVFNGWYKDADCSGAPFEVVQTYDQEDAVYYAGWSLKTYSLRLYTGGGVLSSGKNKITYDFTSRLITLPNASKPGYTFEGWFDSPSYTGNALTKFDPSALANVTLYAKWTPIRYNLTLNSNGGTLEQNEVVYTIEDGLVELPVPTLAGKYFAGWYTNKDFNGEPIWDWDVSKVDNYTIFAKYSDTPVSIPETVLLAHEVVVSSDVEKLLVSMNYKDKKSKDTTTPVATTAGNYTRKLVMNKGTVNDGIRFTSTSDFYSTCWENDYNAITFWAYSEAITNAQFGVVAVSADTTSTTSFSYTRFDVKVDWVGWKQITISFDSKSTGGNVSWKNGIKWLWICDSGWGYQDTGIEGTPTTIYLSDIYLTYITSPYTVVPEDLTLADLAVAKQRFRDMLVGNEELNQISDVKSQISFSKTSVMSTINTMKTGDTEKLWGSFPSVEGNGTSVQNHYEEILKLAKAYGTVGSPCYKDPAVLAGIVKGLDWMYNNAYNEKTASPGNWWQWQIGAPEALIKTLLIIEDDLNVKYKGRMELYLKAVDHFTPLPFSTTANRTWTGYVALGAALLHNDAEKTVTVVQKLLSLFEYVTSGDGFYEDGSYIMHKKNPYLGGYGSNYMLEGTELIYVLQGSKLALDQSYMDNFFQFFFNSYVPFIYNSHTLAFVSGRGIKGYAGTGGAGWYARVFDVIQFANEEDQVKYYNLLASEMKRCNSDDMIKSSIKWTSVTRYQEFKANYDKGGVYTIADANPIYAGVYGSEDRVIKRASSYLVALAMSSTRLYRYESINGANQDGWYEGDGVLYVYSSPNDFGKTYWDGIDMYRLPGITCTTAKRALETQNSVDDSPLGSYAFVGGVTNDAESPLFAVSAMHFGADTHAKESKKIGYAEDLDAKKAYFMFDNEIVCIGNSITSSTSSDIYTVIDNRLIPSPSVTINGETISLGTNKKETGVNYMTVSSFGGIYFPTATDVVINKNANHLEYLIDHGVAPTDASYVYVLLPNSSGVATKNYATNPQIQVIQNNGDVTAVSESKTNSTGYVFWNKDVTCDFITAKNACMIYTTTNEDGTITFSISEPTQLLSKLTVELAGEFTVTGEGITSSISAGKTTVEFDVKNTYGKTLTVTLSPNK